ncbi:MAG: methyltransferase domain-containing protein, partial [Pseudomonadota bacterium]
EAEGVGDRVEIRRVSPGPMPVEDGSVDVVFSKDSIVHIADKHALARDVFRALRSGGWFAASDWLIGHEGPPSPEMAAYIAAEDLDFQMAAPTQYRDALVQAGFVDVALVNRNPWYREQAKAELERLQGPERPEFEALLPDGDLEGQLTTWRAMIGVLESGEHCPHHLRGRKP